MARKRKTDDQIEQDVASRHARIAREREEELRMNPTRDLASLTEQMRAMCDHLDGLPDSQSFDLKAIDDLDDCRIVCFHLKTTIEAILQDLTGA